MKRMKHLLLRSLLSACAATTAGALWAQTPGECVRTPDGAMVTDMAGRTVVLPGTVRRVATVGSVPVINGYLLALDAGDRIVNGLPGRFTASGRWALHLRIASHLADLPVLQGQADTGVNLENLMLLSPDVVITMDRMRIRSLEAARIPVLYLEWGSEVDIRRNMHVLGCALDRMAQGEDYLRYFDGIMQKVRTVTDDIPPGQRPRVLYFNPHSMTTPLLIANWWIAQAGGQSVTEGWAAGGNAQYSHERLLQWDPEVLIVGSPEQVEAVYRDERFSRLAAVKGRRVHATPMGSHSWGQRTIEQPLTVLWAAGLIHPQLFLPEDLAGEIKAFYRRFFGYELSDADIAMMLASGTQGQAQPQNPAHVGRQ